MGGLLRRFGRLKTIEQHVLTSNAHAYAKATKEDPRPTERGGGFVHRGGWIGDAEMEVMKPDRRRRRALIDQGERSRYPKRQCHHNRGESR